MRDTDLDGFKLFPDGKRLVVALEVWPEAKTIADTIKRDEADAKKKVKARAYDSLAARRGATPRATPSTTRSTS